MRSDRLFRALILLPIGLAAWRLVALIKAQVALIREFPTLPQWDMAKYGLGGVRLADDIRHLDPLSFLVHVNEMSVWPPGIALLEMPVLLLFGDAYAVPRLLMLTLGAALAVSLLWAGHCLDRRDGWMIGLIAVFFLLASPLHQAFGTLIMLEIPGSLLLILCLASCWRAGPQSHGARWRTTCWLSALLFFCKYNYGLMWLIPWLVNEAIERSGSVGQLVQLLKDRAAHFEWTRPRHLAAILVGGLLATVQLTGGFRFETEWGTLSMTSIGGPLYALYLLAVLAAAIRPRRSRERLGRLWQSLHPRNRVVARWTVLPIAIWMIFPPHVKEFFDFLSNRSSELPSEQIDTWLYYFRILGTEYAASSWTNWLVWPAAVLLLIRWRGLDWNRRLLALVLCGTLLPPILHPYKLPRFLFTATGLLWLTTGEALARLIRSTIERHGRIILPVQLTMSLGLGGLLLLPGIDHPRLQREIASRGVGWEVRPVLDRLVAELEAAPPGESLVLGTWNLLSPPLIEWHWRQKAGADVPPWKSFCAWRPGPPATRLFREPPARPPRTHVLVIERPEASTPAHREETSWTLPIVERFETAPGWTPESSTFFEGTDYRLRVYRWRDPSSSVAP